MNRRSPTVPFQQYSTNRSNIRYVFEGVCSELEPLKSSHNHLKVTFKSRLSHLIMCDDLCWILSGTVKIEKAALPQP